MPRHTRKQKASETRGGKKKKKVDSCRGRAGVESVVVVGHEGAYKPNDTLMVNGGLC